MPFVRVKTKPFPGMEMVKRLSLRLDPERNYRHVALVMKGGAIKSIGLNITRHAEVAALMGLFPDERYGVKIVSVRIRKDGSFAMAKPCKECEEFMRMYGVKKVVWSDSNGVFHTERYR
jgi:formylmethanofuran dehydrogenase subunit E